MEHVNLRIEPVGTESIRDLCGLIREFAAFEKLDGVCRVTEDSLHRALLSEGSGIRCLMAERAGRFVGYALFYPIFRTFSCMPAMYLEDLYVTSDARGSGVGLGLLRAVARESADRGIRRVDWQVLRWNSEAMDFYGSLGAGRDDGNVDFRISGEAFDRLVGE